MLAFRRLIVALLVVSLSGLGVPLQAQAGMIPADAAAQGLDRERVQAFLERAEVRAQLLAQGVDPADIKGRVAALTDEEAAELARNMDTLPAGGILGAILLVFLVLLLTDILGFTKVFPFTRSVR